MGRQPKIQNELEELREENTRLREIVANLSELVLTRIAEAAEPAEQSGSQLKNYFREKQRR